ncbi:MAG: cell envelope-related transcriptional attenuator [Frankiales bacterium]|nr:cell envelope-related transcriptional attenuator [Frankiales bacterium]
MSPRQTAAPKGKRAQLRAERKRRNRRVSMSALAVAAALSLLVAGLLTLRAADNGKKTTAPERTQHTLLLQVQRPDRTAVSSALLAHDTKTKLGSVVLIPPQVLAQVPGVGNFPFGRALALGNQQDATRGSRNAIADLLAVTVDGSWVLDVATFQRLIDQLGGVQVTVDVAVVQNRTVLLNPGAQRLSGAQAEQFASYLGAGEQEQARLARLQEVLDGIVNSLPKDPGTLLRSLGAGSRSSVTLPVLGAILSGLNADDDHDDLQYRSLPVLPVQAGDDKVLFRIDGPAVKALVGELLAPSVPPGADAGGNRVLVLNGVGTPGLGAKVRERLLPAGFVYVGSRNAPTLDYVKTQVLVKDATAEGAALGARVAKALGVPTSSVSSSDQIGTVADVVVIVGRDFKSR